MTITARQAAYAAIALNFLRKTLDKVSPAKPGKGRPRFVAIYPYFPVSAITGSFPTREEAEHFADRLMRYAFCTVTVEDLDDWREITSYHPRKPEPTSTTPYSPAPTPTSPYNPPLIRIRTYYQLPITYVPLLYPRHPAPPPLLLQ